MALQHHIDTLLINTQLLRHHYFDSLLHRHSTTSTLYYSDTHLLRQSTTSIVDYFDSRLLRQSTTSTTHHIDINYIECRILRKFIGFSWIFMGRFFSISVALLCYLSSKEKFVVEKSTRRMKRKVRGPLIFYS